MMRNKCCCLQKVLCAMIAVLLLTVSLTGGAFAQEKEYAFTYRSGSYAAYDQQYASLPAPSVQIHLDGTAGVAEDGARCSIQQIEGKNSLVWDDQKGSVTWFFAVEEAGRYALELEYYALPHAR